MEVSDEKLSELAQCLKKIRVLENEDGKPFIRESAIEDFETVSKNMEIIRENFKYFFRQPNFRMYPDDFIRAMRFLPNGNQILADNLEYILESTTNRDGRAHAELVGISEVSEKVANNFEDIFNVMVSPEKPEESRKHSINPDMKYVPCCSANMQGRITVMLRWLIDSEQASEVLDKHKELFLNSDFNTAMADIVRVLAKNPACHDFIRDNFSAIKDNCYVLDLIKLYCNIREVYPEEFEKEAFTIDQIYMPAKKKASECGATSQLDKICSRIIAQGRTKELDSFANFLKQNATIEPDTLKFLGIRMV